MNCDLTIIMPSWNKEPYVSEALDSIFAQKTTRTYRILVADDHSTDRTLEIVEAYSAAHPGAIEVLRSDCNRKLFKNVRRAYELCKTPYFCVLDPDDYWTDERHLEKALGFLDSHPDYTIYSAGIEMLHRDGRRSRIPFPETARDSTWKDYLAQRATIAFTQTCVYRNVVFRRGLPDRLKNPKGETVEKTYRGDSFRNFLHIREGRAHFEPAVEGCYRETDEGVFQGLGDAGKLLLNAQLFADLWRYDDGRFTGLLQRSREFYRQAVAALPSVLAAYGGDVEKLRSTGAAFEALRTLYAEHESELRSCTMQGLSLKRKICYRAYLYLLRRRIIVEV